MIKSRRSEMPVRFGILCAGLIGCMDAAPKASPTPYAVRTDASGLAERIHIQDSAAWSFRWVEIPRVPGPQRIGPTDSRLLVLARRNDSTIPAAARDTSKSHGDLEIPLEIADSLFPSNLRKFGKRDSLNVSIGDTLRRAPFLPMSWYGEGVALRMGRSILMEFDSH